MDELPISYSAPAVVSATSTHSANSIEYQNGHSEENDTMLSSVKEIYCCSYASCSFSTAWKSSLNMHMKNHTDERPWQCVLCNKHFKLKHHLKHHVLTHSQHKLFKCSYCEYRCNDSHSMHRHKVNRHRFPLKGTVKKSLLPTVVSLPSVEALRSTRSNFLNSLLEQQRDLNPVSTDPASRIPVCSSSISSSINQIRFQQNKQNSGNLKLRTVRSASDSFALPFLQRTSSSERDPLIDLVGDYDKSTNKQLYTSSAGTGSNPVTLKEKIPRECGSIDSSMQKNSSQMSLDYLHGNRSSLNYSTSKSPITSEKQFTCERREHSSSSALKENRESTKPGHSASDVNQPRVSSVRSLLETNTSVWKCSYCDIIFPDNIMYGLHMGCHAVGNPFQCNICGMKCKNSRDFMFHFTIGKHIS